LGYIQTPFCHRSPRNREDQTTGQEGGYHSANSAMEAFQTDTAEAFANLASATAADRTMLQELLATNSQLLAQLTLKDQEIAQLRNHCAPALAPATDTANNNRQQQPIAPGNKRFDNLNYCWSCGYDVSLNCTSETCKRKLQAHKDAATHANNLGDSQRNKAKVY
jgi:hypothetical protein